MVATAGEPWVTVHRNISLDEFDALLATDRIVSGDAATVVL